MECILGIDFGTTNTTAGAFVNGRVELVQDAGDVVIPSVVYAPDRGPLEVGRGAHRRLLQDPSGVIRSVKRVLGTPATSSIVRHFTSQAPFRVETVGEQLRFHLRSGTYAPEQIAAAVLSRVRELAERRFGGRISKAVLTQSAAATPAYRDALMRAAKIAHLEILALVPEPIAGALAVGLHAEPAERRLLVCDFGGGTFDVSAVEQSGLKFSAIATAGDAFLGGDDLDDAIAEGLAGRLYRLANYDIHRDAVRWHELVIRAEMAKRRLSDEDTAPFAMREAYVDRGETKSLELVLDRTWVEARWESLFERAGATVDAALARAGWRHRDVDRVALIGGSTMVPMFFRTIAQRFPLDRIVRSAHADISVAVGAVLLTARYQPQHGTGLVPVLAAG